MSSPSKTTTRNQSIKQFQERRQQQQTRQRVTKQLETQRKTAQIRMQKIREAQKRLLITKKRIAKKQQEKQTQNQKDAEKNLNVVCKGAGCTCSFHGDTQVLTKEGFEPIKSLVVGQDYVWSKNEYTGETDWKPITAHYSNPYEETATISIRGLASGETQTIVSNRIHPFYVNTLSLSPKMEGGSLEFAPMPKGKWVQAQHLQFGDLLLTESSHLAEVVGLEIKDESLEAYNIAVEGFHTYFVRGASNDGTSSVLVHNECDDKRKVANEFHKDAEYLAREKHFHEVVAAAKLHPGPKVMLGKHSGGSAWRKFGYDKAAKETGARHFEMGKRSWESLSNFRKWRRNAEFLRDGVRQNARFYLATPAVNAGGEKVDGWYEKEIKYLQKNGYVFSDNGQYMFKP